MFRHYLNYFYNAAHAPTRPQFDLFMRRVQLVKPTTYNHMMTVLPLLEWSHHTCKQGNRIDDTVTSNDRDSFFNMVDKEVRLL